MVWGLLVLWGQLVVHVGTVGSVETASGVGTGVVHVKTVGGVRDLRDRLIPSSLPVPNHGIHVHTCMTWCTFTECLFFFISSRCSESGPVCAVSLN